VAPADGVALRLMYRRCTPLTRYHRFLTTCPDIPADHLRALLSRDAGTDALLVVPVADPDRAMSLGSTAPYRPGVAEVGVLLGGAWQRRGVGRLFLRRLAERCRRRGVATLTTQTLCGRRALLGAVREEAGGPVECGPLSGTVRMTAKLAARSPSDAQL
jgi:GNAT superfamily N-acetyltransferase